MTFPTIEAAAVAKSIGVFQSALIHQFRRLEADIAAPLDIKSVRLIHETDRRGAALIRALSRPDV